MRRPSPAAAWLLSAALAAGITARLAFLGYDSFWLDEAFGIVKTYEPVSELWVRADPRHPPLYYLVLKAVTGVLGRSEAAARLPSALASVLNLFLIFLLARRVGLPRASAGLAAALLAVSTIDIWHAREARMYALATTCGLVSAIGLAGLSRERSGPSTALETTLDVILVAASSALAIYLDYTMIPVVALAAGLWGARWWRLDRRAASAVQVGIALALVAAALAPLWPQLQNIAVLADGATVFRNLRRVVGEFHLTTPIVIAGLVLEVAGVAAAALVLARRRARTSGTAVAVLFALANAVLAVPRGYSFKQVLVTAWPFVALAVAWRVDAASKVARAALAVSIAAAVAMPIAVHRADWRGAVAYLNQAAAADALVIVDPVWNAIPYDLYHPAHAALDAVPARLDRAADVWLVAERSGAPPPTSVSEAWLDAHAELVARVRFARLEVRRYRIKP